MGAHFLLRFCFILLLATCANVLPPSIDADPIGVPNLQQCELATGPPGVQLNCCLPIPAANKSVISFSFSSYKSQKRVRQLAHKVSANYIAKYNRAYKLMKALPANDPRSFATQAKMHCAFCNGASYRQAGPGSAPLQVHFSWLFLPWHRWYLYFHERILQSLLGDPSFSLVVWNWDDQRDGGNVMPAMFLPTNSAVYDANRNQANLPPTIVRLVPGPSIGNDSTVVRENLNAMYQDIVMANTAELFMGGAYRLGTDLTNTTPRTATLGGSLENGVHGGVHFWTGDPRQPLRQDMGSLTDAAQDPIFYAHHSNVDRLWDKWHSGLPGGSRADHSDPDFLNAAFYFYDETGSLVKVTVGDALDNSKLGISYPSVPADALWVKYSPNATTSGSAVAKARASGAKDIGESPQNGTISLGTRLVAIVKAPTGAMPTGKSAKVLEIQALQVERTSFVSLEVFVNLPQASASTTTDSAEFVGTFNIIPSLSEGMNLTTNVKFEIGDSLQRIGIESESEVVISLIVQGEPAITIQGLLIDYE